ncbi:hypothetical protein EVAR_7283_1 [Eumeta japonica]|uniref:Uncharacterized protein n=1 Tax=Eumeta variegata TaxID=151549 RepID=A0A4C1T5E7_EUMVA|nr:hypothetical protein EVAR_7283_1 [Eumeta japonica]
MRMNLSLERDGHPLPGAVQGGRPRCGGASADRSRPAAYHSEFFGLGCKIVQLWPTVLLAALAARLAVQFKPTLCSSTCTGLALS